MLVIYLASCAVKKIVPERSLLEGVDLSNLYTIASRHLLAGIVGTALESADIHDQRFIKSSMNAVRKTVLFGVELTRVLQKFEKYGIWYLPLKGAILKTLYPAVGMREMADNDILFDDERAKDVCHIMKELGFNIKSFDKGNHDIYYKEPVFNFELHRSLFNDLGDETLYKYYSNIKEKLVKDEDNRFGYHLSPEDFYIYMVAHEYKHYIGGGTGLRSLLDIYVYWKQYGKELNKEYLRTELTKLRLRLFEKNNRKLALALFDDQILTEEQEQMLDYFLESGVYGSSKIIVKNELARKGKFLFLLTNIFPTYKHMRTMYPLLKKIPFLYPFSWVCRWITALFTRPQKVLLRIKALFGS